MAKPGRPPSGNKRRYFHTPIPISDDPNDQAVVQWWQHLSPDERLEIVLAMASQPPPQPPPQAQYARCRIPLPDDPAQRTTVDKFRRLKPTQRLAKLKAYYESQ
jgi:hypothetical protein